MSNRFEEDLRRNGLQEVSAGWPWELNHSGFHPRGHAVLGLPYEPPKNGSVIVLPDNVRERTQMLEDKITVIAHGAACWIDEPEKRCEVGDVVLIPYLAGRMYKGKDGRQYRVVNDKDVIGTVDIDAVEVK